MLRIKLTSLKIRNFDRTNIDEFKKLNNSIFKRYKNKKDNLIDVIYYEISKIERRLHPGDYDKDVEDIYKGLTENRDEYYRDKNNWLSKVEAAKYLRCDHRKISEYQRVGCIRAEAITTTRGKAIRDRYCKKDVNELKEELDAKRKN